MHRASRPNLNHASLWPQVITRIRASAAMGDFLSAHGGGLPARWIAGPVRHSGEESVSVVVRARIYGVDWVMSWCMWVNSSVNSGPRVSPSGMRVLSVPKPTATRPL